MVESRQKGVNKNKTKRGDIFFKRKNKGGDIRKVREMGKKHHNTRSIRRKSIRMKSKCIRIDTFT